MTVYGDVVKGETVIYKAVVHERGTIFHLHDGSTYQHHGGVWWHVPPHRDDQDINGMIWVGVDDDLSVALDFANNSMTVLRSLSES